MFLDNKYKDWYFKLMATARARVIDQQVEWHHVIPRSLGGLKGEVVALTYREHFVAHLLLTKFTAGQERRKMNHALAAFMASSGKSGWILTSRQFQRARVAWREALTGQKRKPFTAETRLKMSISAAKRATPESMAKAARALRGCKHTEATRENLAASKRGDKNPMYGKPVSAERRRKQSIISREASMARRTAARLELEQQQGTLWTRGA